MTVMDKISDKKRDILPDIIRGFAIILVVWGHCIQEGNGADFSARMLYFDDKLYQFIYSFHMPLFALIAGYFAYSSMKRATDNKKAFSLLRRRVSLYLIPIVFWTLTEYVREMVVMMRLGVEHATGFDIVPDFIIRVLCNHWFLWAMIFCFAVVWVVHLYLKDSIIVYVLMFAAFLVIPDGMNLHTYKYLLPYYLLAYYAHGFFEGTVRMHSGISSMFKRLQHFHGDRPILFTALLGVLFLALFLLYDRRAFIYVSGYRLGKNIWYLQLAIDAYRFVIGLAGSLFFVCLWERITGSIKKCRFNVLRVFGQYSLGVYIFSGYLTILAMRHFTDALPPNDLRTILETLIIAPISLFLTVILAHVPIARRIVGR